MNQPTPRITPTVAPSPPLTDARARAVQAAYERAARTMSVDHGGDYRKWARPADHASWAERVASWVSGTITGPWCLPADTARQACEALVGLLGDVQASATVEIRRVSRSSGATGYTVVIVAIVYPGEEPALAAAFHPTSAVRDFVAAFDGVGEW